MFVSQRCWAYNWLVINASGVKLAQTLREPRAEPGGAPAPPIHTTVLHKWIDFEPPGPVTEWICSSFRISCF